MQSETTTPQGDIPAFQATNAALGPVSQPSSLRLSQIKLGTNPRTHFDPVQMSELEQSIKASGVLQSILVRPVNGHYEIIAGERRYRAACAVLGQDHEVPVLVKVMSDAEAELAGTVENTQRADMSPTDEANAAARVLGRCKGDRAEAALQLGWSRSTLDKRLALTYCSALVQKALTEGQIVLGIAELLATLSKDVQDKLIGPIIEKKETVAVVKALIAKFACSLDSKYAIFDQSDCATCNHNSALQRSMFSESIDAGNCTNRTCYTEKNEAALEAIKDKLIEEYPVIRIVRAGEGAILTKLIATEPGGVGEEQALACRSCANFGAAVSALPAAMGQVFKGQCFDLECNANKVADEVARKKAAATEAAKSQAAISKGDSQSKSDVQAAEKPVEKVTVSVNEGDRIKAYREKVWRLAMKKEIVNNPPSLANRYLIAMCIIGCARNVDQKMVSATFENLTHQKAGNTMAVAAAGVQTLDDDQISKLTTTLAVSAIGEIDVRHLVELAKHQRLDLHRYWKLDQEFLDLLTKSEIEVVARQVGLDKAMGDAFKKLFSEKKADLIKQLLSVKDFDYSAVIPTAIKLK